MLTTSMYEIITYEESTSINDVIKTIEDYSTIKKACVYYHDKDEDKKPHYHTYIHLGTSRPVSYMEKIFNLPNNYFNKVIGRWVHAVLYGCC